MMSLPEMLTPKEVAETLKISYEAALAFIKYSGIDYVKVVQQRLGHADVSITLNTYTHVLPGMDQEAAAKIDDLIFNNASNS